MDESRAQEKLLKIAHRLEDEQYNKPCRNNEQATKKWFIEPIFEALGWDVQSPDVYPEDNGGVSSKADYGMRIDSKIRIFVEAKSLGKTLDDKDAEQTSNYANNKGVAWCALTNGRIWRVYKSSGAALSERLLFEIDIQNTPNEITAAWQQLRYLSRSCVQNGELDKYGNQTFVDNRLRDELRQLLKQPSLKFINALKETLPNFPTDQIKDALKRMTLTDIEDNTMPPMMKTAPEQKDIQAQSKKPSKIGSMALYTETHHLQGKSQQVIHLFYELQQRILAIAPPQHIQIVYKKQTIGYQINDPKKKKGFADVTIYNSHLRLFLVVDPQEFTALPPIARNVKDVGHWGNGDLEFKIHSSADIETALTFIKRTYEKNAGI